MMRILGTRPRDSLARTKEPSCRTYHHLLFALSSTLSSAPLWIHPRPHIRTNRKPPCRHCLALLVRAVTCSAENAGTTT